MTLFARRWSFGHWVIVAGCALAASLMVNTAHAQTEAPRLLAPRAGWCSLGARPTLRWRRASGAQRVELCRERACSAVVAQADVDGDTWTPPSPLAAGVWFWRVRSGERVSPVWAFTVTARAGTSEAVVPRCTDVDGDGFGDVLLMESTGRGAVSLLWGSRRGLVRRRAVVLPEAPTEHTWGRAGHVSLAGDLDGDGRADLLWWNLNAFTPARGTRGAGLVQVFRGGARGLATTPALRLAPTPSHAERGADTALAGDVDGDGLGDLLMVDWLREGARRVRRITLVRRLLSGAPVVEAIADPCAPGLVATYASAGDVDGDGYGDVVLACGPAPPVVGVAVRPRSPSVAYVLHGSDAGLGRSEALGAGGGATPVDAEVRVATLGDLDGDGDAEVIAAWRRDIDGPREALVWRGAPDGMTGPERITRPDLDDQETPPEYFAWQSSVLGDTDGDGRDEVVLSGTDRTQFLVRGGSLTAPLEFTRGDGFPTSFFGLAIPCGDVNGDGFADVLLGTTCAESDVVTGDACVRHAYQLLPGAREGLDLRREQSVLE